MFGFPTTNLNCPVNEQCRSAEWQARLTKRPERRVGRLSCTWKRLASSRKRASSLCGLALRARTVCRRGICRATDGVAVDNKFDAAVPLAPFHGVIGRHGLRFAE